MDEETTRLEEEAFDAGWDDKDEPEVFEGEAEAEPESEGEEPEQETEESEQKEETDDSESEGADQQTEGGEEAEEQRGEEFVLKHLGEEKTVNRDEVVTLAQKGMDYDRIREKWDGVKDDVPKLRMYESFLKELAESRGGDIESLIDETRTRTLIARAEARGEELTPAAAAAQAVKMRTEFATDPEEARQEKSQREITRFLGAYPDVKAEDIPKEVWEGMIDGDLLGSYQRYENRKLKDEIKALKRDLEDAKQQKKNKERSTGSSKSVGTSAGRDAFDEGWDAEY